MITATTVRNIWLIVETIIMSQLGMCYVEHNSQGAPSHHGFSLLINIECACVEYYPGCIVPGKMSKWLLWTSRRNLCVSQKPRFLHSQVMEKFKLRLFITNWIWWLLVWRTIVNTSIIRFTSAKVWCWVVNIPNACNFHRYLST